VRVNRSIAAVLITLAAALAAAGPAQARTLQIGIADDAALSRGGRAADEVVEDWRRAGVDTVRIQVPWARIAPDPGSAVMPPGFLANDHLDALYSWGHIDAAVARAASAGIKPILMITGPPPLWASGNPGRGNPRYRPSAPAFANFAFAVATRYASAADEYILWNEPNLPVWIQPQATCGKRRCTPVSPNIYRAMVRAAYPAIHQADAGARVLIGALAPAGGDLRSTNANMRPLAFLRALGCVDADLRPIPRGGCRGFQPAIADGIAYHPHSTRHAPSQPYAHPDNADLGSLKKVERLLDRLQRLGRLQGTSAPLSLWLDEYGYQTNPPDRLRGVSPGAQDRYLQQASYIAWSDPRVVNFTQYLWRDEPAGGGRKYTGWQSGLYDSEGDPKPALAHFDDPIWVDFRRGVVWGQVRPGGIRQVTVQRRLAGGTTGWETLATIATAPDGAWQITTPAVAFATYRAVADDGSESARMIAVPPGQASEDADPEVIDSDEVLETRTVGVTAGAPIPRSFAGFSLEYSSAQSYLGATRPNPIFARLVETLAEGGNGSPTIRLGGNSSDESWWNPIGAPRPPGVSTDVTPTWLGVLGQWAGQTRTPLVLGLNLALGDPDNAAAYVQAAAGTLPPGTLAGVEIGNEPDLYTRPRTFTVGDRHLSRGMRRPTAYAYGDYRAEAERFRTAIAAAAPGVPMAEGGFATSAWEDHEDDLLSQGGPGPRAFSAHTYSLHTCDRRRARPTISYARSLLGSSAFAPPVTRMAQLAAVARAHGATFRVSETNSANCGGVRGASNSLASALWGADMLFALADAGVRSVNFHAFSDALYTPVDFGLHKGHFAGRVNPLFYGMLLFARANPKGARLLPTGPNPASGRLKTWATVDPLGIRRVVVINKDTRKTHTVRLAVPGGARRARVRRLAGPKVTATRGITFAGQGWGDSTSDGELRGRATVERAQRRSGAFRIVMPPSSAALVTVRRGG
jgi:hypothetical protein